MKVLDFLELFDGNNKIDIWDYNNNDNLLSFYDGRNSINNIYNNYKIAKISSHIDEYDDCSVIDLYVIE